MKDIEYIINKYTDFLFADKKRKTVLEYETETVKEGIRFKDIEYQSCAVSNWSPYKHLQYLTIMLANAGEKKIKTDSAFREKMLLILNYWLKNDFQNQNWWYNEIGIPRLLADVCFFLRKYLSTEQFAQVQKILLRGSLKGNSEILCWTGANLMWGIFGTLNHALLTRDERMLEEAVNRLAAEISVKEGLKDGIKPDMSFYQHGPMMYIYGYGRNFVEDTALLLYLLSGTKYMPCAQKVQLFEKFVLEGCQWFAHNGYADFMTVGREIARPNSLLLSEFAKKISLMVDTEEYTRKEELKAFYASLCGNAGSKIKGIKVFPYVYMLTAHTQQSYFSAKGVHTDYQCCEAGNHENYLTFNFTNGATVCFMAQGDAYFNLSPVYDYTLIPGVTAFAENDADLRRRMGDCEKWYKQTGATDCCVLKQRDGFGILAMQIKNASITGFCSRTLFEGGMVLVGSAISEKQEHNKSVVTAIDQCRLRENCSLALGEKRSLKQGQSVINGAFVYINLSAYDMIAEACTVTGNWKRNNLTQSDATVTENVFKVYFEHGILPENAGYAVCVCEENAADSVVDIVNRGTVQKLLFSSGKMAEIQFSEEKCSIEIQ